MKKKSTDNFGKFAQKKSNAAIKEQFRQEKRKYNKEKQAFFAKKKAEENADRNSSIKENRNPQLQVKPNAIKRKLTHEKMPLNKFIAHAGICGRREAAELVKKGLVKVNGTPVNEPGFKVSHSDAIHLNGKKIFISKNLVYILLNKPKDYITTTADPQGRKTVHTLIQRATKERVYPVGRLDRNTTGVLLFTNDGELAQKLTHPSHEIKKVYQVTLDKPLHKADFDKILTGIQLEDGAIKADALAYSTVNDKKQIGIEIHSGRNRIVRRMFESLGYNVKNLDRVIFAGLTKKNIERGKWRFLQEKEIRDLKHFTKGQ